MKILGILILTTLFAAFLYTSSEQIGFLETIKAVGFSLAVLALTVLGIYLVLLP